MKTTQGGEHETPKTEWTVTITRYPSMSKGAFRAKLIDALNDIGLEQSVIDTLVVKSASKVQVNDSIRYTFSYNETLVNPNINKTLLPNSQVPYIARLTLCLFTAPQNQASTLGDFEEKLNQIWIPNCGARVGCVVCIWHAVRSVGAIVRIGVMTAIIDSITRALGQ